MELDAYLVGEHILEEVAGPVLVDLLLVVVDLQLPQQSLDDVPLGDQARKPAGFAVDHRQASETVLLQLADGVDQRLVAEERLHFPRHPFGHGADVRAPWASQLMKSSTLISPTRRSWSVTGVPEIRLSLRMARRSFIRLWGRTVIRLRLMTASTLSS